MTYKTSASLGSNFIVSTLNGAEDPTQADMADFATEEGLDAVIINGSIVPDKDKPHLTVNDKEFAARYTFSNEGIEPQALLITAEETPEPVATTTSITTKSGSKSRSSK